MSQGKSVWEGIRYPVITATLISMLMVAFWQYTARTRTHQNISAETHLNNGVQQLQQAFNQTDALLLYLQELTAQHPDINPARFQHMAALWLGQHEFPALRVVQLAKDAVISHVHPLTGNEASLGHDLLADPSRRKEAKAAYLGFRTVTTPVLNLRQGGQGIIHRMSIRLPGSEQPWGLAVVVQDWERLRELSGFNDRESEFTLMIRGRTEASEPWGKAFVGRDADFSAPNVLLQEISVPGGHWQVGLAIKRAPAWYSFMPLLLGGNLLLLMALYTLRKSIQDKDWPIPTVVAGTLLLLLAVFITLYLLVNQAEKRRHLATWSTINQRRVTSILNSHADFAHMIALQRGYGELPPELFRQKGEEYVRENPELVNFTWVDRNYVIQEVTPREGNQQILGLRIELEEPRRTSRLARELGSGVYTRPFPAIQGGWSFEYWVPVFGRDRHFQGLVVIVYSMDRLMESIRENEEAADLDMAMVSDLGEPLVGSFTPGARPEDVYTRRLIPPGHGLRLVLSHKGQSLDPGVISVAVLGAILSLVLFLSLHRLQRSRRELARQNQILDETQQRLVNEKELVHTTLDALHEGVITLNRDFGIETANTAALDLLTTRHPRNLPLITTLDLVDDQGQPLAQAMEKALERAGRKNQSQVTAMQGERTYHCAIRPLYRGRQGARGYVLIFHDVTQARMREEKLRRRASHDPLTQCLNRQGFRQKYRALMALSAATDIHSLAFMDLDKFKAVNDTAGHGAGDRLLVELSRLIQGRLRNSDILARMGGDEFVILLPHCKREDALPLLEKIRRDIQNHGFVHQGQTFHVGASMGLVEFSAHAPNREILDRADKACYQAKRGGRNCIACSEAPSPA